MPTYTKAFAGILIFFLSQPFLFAQGNFAMVPNEGVLNKITQLSAATYLGGSGTDDVYETSIAVDNDGNVFVSGITSSGNFPVTPGAYKQNYSGGGDRFVAKFDASLQNLLACTLIGGTSAETGMGIEIDQGGKVYIAGYTYSSNFPTTEGAYDRTHNGGFDVYLAVLNNDLTELLAATYFGGSGSEGQQWPRIDIKVGGSGNIYLAGLTNSTNLPLKDNSFDKSFAGGSPGGDAFIAKFNNSLTELLGSTYLGGSGNEWRVSIELDKNEDVYLCGETESSNFNTTPAVYGKTFSGSSDIFVSHLNSNLTALLASTLLGTASVEEALAMRIDPEEKIVIAGYTYSSSFPTTAGSYRPSFAGGGRDGYVAKFSPDLTTLLASTFIGGNSHEWCRDIEIDRGGNIYITGNTLSSNFPTTGGASYSAYNGGVYNGDGFVAVMSGDLKTLSHSSFFGGSGEEEAGGIALDANNNLYIAGFTNSLDLPTTAGSYKKEYNGGVSDCFVSKFSAVISSLGNNAESLPSDFRLFDNYPNPFNPSTHISFTLSESRNVTLEIFDSNGRLVDVLTDKYLPQGSYSLEWKGKNSRGENVSSGTYLYTLRCGEESITKKMMMMR